MTPKLKKIILIILIAIILFVVYAVFIKKDPTNTADGNLITRGGVLSEDARALGNQISQALLRLEQIKLDRNIFTNNIYITLVDRSEPIIDEPIGRPNPFAPIGDISLNSSTRTNASSTSSRNQTASSTTTGVPSN
jgi:hypothetical protein